VHLQNYFGNIVSRKVAKILSRKVHSLQLCFLAPLREIFFADCLDKKLSHSFEVVRNT
jgi:hypothetical protein